MTKNTRAYEVKHMITRTLGSSRPPREWWKVVNGYGWICTHKQPHRTEEKAIACAHKLNRCTSVDPITHRRCEMRIGHAGYHLA